MDPAHHALFDGLAAICGPAFDHPGVIVSLFIAGVAGSVSHCAGMCGPFVLTQVAARLERVPVDSFGAWARLRGGALVPYHLGRLTTYSLMGAAAGGLTGEFMRAAEFRWLSSAFLLLAAALFLAQIGADVLPRPAGLARFAGQAVSLVSRPIGGLFADPRGWRGYGLGLALGFLPCGLLYSALAASAAAGSAAAGAAAMAAFVTGTFPMLFAVGLGGTALGRPWRSVLQRIAQPLLAFNAVLLIALAIRGLL